MCTHLIRFITESIDSNYPLKTRIHPLNHQLFNGSTLYLKRDDELSFGISGSKYRKYASLLPYLKKIECKEVALVGGYSSNHLVGIMQLLNENNIKAQIFTRQPREDKGNFVFLKMLAADAAWHFLTQEEWKNKDTIIPCTITPNTFYIKEGAENFEAMPGMMTLGLDLIKTDFDHIFMDAGTGFSAIALILCLKELGIKSHVHVVLIAGEEQNFLNTLKFYKEILEKKISKTISTTPFTLYFPKICKSFGSTNEKVFSFIKDFAKKEGVFLDPIYGAKMVMRANEIITENKLHGKILFIHSGGALTLSGFLDKLS